MISARKEKFYQWLLAAKYSIVLIIPSSCNPVKYCKTMETQPQAIYYSFSKNIREQSLDALDTSLIYVNGQDWVRTYKSGKVEKVFSYQYLKFGKNQVAFFSGDSKESFNNVNIYYTAGQYCYYKIEGNELQLELYDYNLKKFTIMYAHIYADKIIFYKDRLRIPGGGKNKLNLIYQKQLIKYTRPLIWPK